MDQRATKAGDSGSDDSSREPPHTAPSQSLSRRDFAARFGAGSAAAVGVAWASPHISTIRFAQKAAVGSEPPSSTSTTSTTIAGTEGSVSISNTAPCAGDTMTVTARGFAPKTAVTIEIDSAEHTIGVTTAGAQGRISVGIQLPTNIPTGAHQLVVVGVRPGGRTLSLSTPINIKTQEECVVGPEGTTTTSSTPTPPTTGGRGTTSTTATPPTTAPPVKVEETPPSKPRSPGNGGLLAFTGTDSVDLALLGAAAAVGGRALFGLVAHRDDDEDDDE